MKIAIVHDWFVAYAGGEKVVEQLLELYPSADLFSLVDYLPEKDRDFLRGKNIACSFIQNLPFSKKLYRNYLPLMPLAIEQFDLSNYDLVISSSAAISKGVITGPNQLHISYCHSPIRYAWDLQHQYLSESNLTSGLKSWVVRWFLHKIRVWDVRTANGVDEFVANSRFIAKRIYKVYRRDSVVIHPPVNTNAFKLYSQKGDYYVTASRLVPYKKIDLLVEAFSQMPDKKLIVIGAGPEYDKIKSKSSKNVLILGYQSHDVLLDYIQNAKAFVFAALEDFGIAPVESQACGTPVIAYGKGGVLDSIKDGVTGVFFDKQNVESVIDAVQRFEQMDLDPQKCRDNAERFSNEQFKRSFDDFVAAKIKELYNNTGV